MRKNQRYGYFSFAPIFSNPHTRQQKSNPFELVWKCFIQYN